MKSGNPSVLLIDRSRPFNPTEFMYNGVMIWRGPKDGNGLTGEEEQDTRSLVLNKIDFTKVLFEHCLKKGERSIGGEESLKRLIVAHVLLDAKIGQRLFEENGHMTLEWLYQTFGIKWIEFPGTVLRYLDGNRYFLYLSRDDGQWYRKLHWLDDGRLVSDLFAILAP
jgi:hypothetical protein